MAEKLKTQNGFTLLEVLIALSVFAFFAAAYVTRESYNLSLSSHIREEEHLQTICENVINKELSSDKEFSETLLTQPETKTIEDDPGYEYTVEWKKIKMPDYKQLLPEEEREAQSTGGASGIEQSLFDQVKTNMESMIWQLKVTITNKNTKYSYSLSTWTYNPKAQVKFGGI